MASMEFNPALRYAHLPSVVIAGRPNVGKSTLFNRLAHKRRAITDSTPGLTRDPVGAEIFMQGMPLKLIDTGGFKLDRGNPESDESRLDDIVVARTLAQIENADIIVLLLAAGDITSEDEEFIKMLRPFRENIIVAVNKTEGGRLQAEAWNVLQFGFQDILMISAEHGDNIGDLEKTIIGRLDFSRVAEKTNQDEIEERPPIRIALAGKPNTGKSSLSNRLTGSEGSIVSDIPGTTRDTIEGSFVWKGRDFFIIDTAGMRRKSKVTENIEYYSVNRAIKSFDEADIVILLIDAQEGLSDQDKKIASLACERGRAVIFALNKWDLMPQIKNTFAAVCDKIHFSFGQMEYAPIIPVSAKDGSGVKELLDTATKIAGQLTKKIETSAFNAALEKWQIESPPPSGPQTRFKIKYGVQVSANPVVFKLFVSRPRAVSQSYTSYICNKIRKDLGYSMIPIELQILPSRSERRS
jgi:GTP-binding protein